MSNHTDTSRSGDLVADIRKQASIQIGFDGPAYQTLTRWADRIEALEAENERLRGALENIGNLSLNGRIKVNTLHGEWVGTPDAYAREVLGMPWRTEDPDDSIEAMENWSD